MSPLLITALIIGGIALLIAIGYINHVVENSKLEKARLKAELNDRVRRCAQISESLPGQFVSPSLKLLMSQIELSLSEQQLALEKKADAGLKARIEELRALVAKGESIPVRNPPQAILTEDKAKEVRFLFEALHAQLTRFTQDGQAQVEADLQRLQVAATAVAVPARRQAALPVDGFAYGRQQRLQAREHAFGAGKKIAQSGIHSVLLGSD